MTLTVEMLEARRAELARELAQHQANAHACQGALQLLAWCLEQIQTPEA